MTDRSAAILTNLEPPIHPDAGAALKVSERIVITNVTPNVDRGRYPAKAVVGDWLDVACDVLTDGHERLGVALRSRRAGEATWHEMPMVLAGNDRWDGRFALKELGTYDYTIVAWRDDFATWCEDAKVRVAAGQNMEVELQVARGLIVRAIREASTRQTRDRFHQLLVQYEKSFSAGDPTAECLGLLQSPSVRKLFYMSGPRDHLAMLGDVLSVRVERVKAAFSAWYELTPRSQSGDTKRHGTFDDVIARLPYVRDLGFDVLYLTPIHPIGSTNRKGRNNSLVSVPGDPGSLYAIGGSEGGHDAIHPELGTFDDFARLIERAREQGLEIALDFAIQCSLDHPWIKEHPEWFDWRPDGSIRFAENPPKKYEDIVNVHFYGESFPGLWLALRDVVLFWVGKGVRIFRVDNPHTKPFPFWEWLIGEVHAVDPLVIFLSEAFTRPKIMQQLAKIGFTQSYSYFTWRNTKAELTDYLTELARGPSRAYMRPNFFVNTPDINPFILQTGGRPAFRSRLVLAATLGGNYGLYSGFELCEAAALPGKEEYLNSEKYEIRAWDWDRPGHIRDDIRFINGLRRTSPALQKFDNVTFYNAWNDQILYYAKVSADRSDVLLIAVNLDPHNSQQADFEIPLWEFGLPDHASIEADDLVTGSRFTWTGKVQHMRLDPHERPYAIWRLYPAGRPS